MDGDVIVRGIFPPIPSNDYDYCAWYQGHEERGPTGFGATPRTALIDLVENYDIPLEVTRGWEEKQRQRQ